MPAVMQHDNAHRAPAEEPSGTWMIVRYNWSRYAAAGALIVIAASAWLAGAPYWLSAALTLVALPGAFWTAVSIAVSYYVYDGFGLLRWRWMTDQLTPPDKRWVLIHAGLDQASDVLSAVWPRVQGVVLDVYNPRRMTEPSIDRARRDRLAASPSLHADFDALPLAGSSVDVVFMLMAAHELRAAEDRQAMFAEAARIVTPTGRLVLVEHLRNAANFVAYGPGFLHFFSRRQWLADAAAGGWVLDEERPATPFVRLFVLRRA